SPRVSMEEKKEPSTTADCVRSGWPLRNRFWSHHPIESLNKSPKPKQHAVFPGKRS
ncbi:hypothetical protein TNCV_2791821, partial [Trichonephila clavipes]